MFLTKAMVEKAFDLAEPSIKAILEAEGTTWGPRYVQVVVSTPNNTEQTKTIGIVTEWQESWGEEVNFHESARMKLDISIDNDGSSREVSESAPWLLNEGDSLHPGAVTEDGITVATSGAMSETDEGISNLVLSMIKLICFLKLREMKEKKIDKVD